MNVYLIVALVLAVYMVLAWFTGTLLQLHGASLWILRGSLALVGLVGAGVFIWFHRRVTTGRAKLDKSAAITEQITVLLRQAGQKLMYSKRGSIGSLPVVFILGESNSAKTSTILHSGLEPELLAGHVFHDSDVVPTATINVWFAKETIFIEAGGKLATDSHAWMHLLRQTLPPRFSAAVRKGEQAPRAALVCFDCERFGAAQISGQKLSSRLKEMVQSLGAPFPVYVLFTKLDRVAHFAEYVGNLTSQESAQVLGTTLLRMNTQGVFAEEQSKRLVSAFDQIVYSLAEKRLEYLPRERAEEKVASIYEFPREFRKFRDQVVQFLVELTRPTQLSSNPFLRGFYFSGVRAVIINQAVSMAAGAKSGAVAESRATRMFNYAEMEATQPAPVRSIQSRKFPEWTFLPHLFTDIVLRDRTAFSSSNRSTKVDGLRRVLLALATTVCAFFVIAFVVSFLNNRTLQNEIHQPAARLAAYSAPADVPQLEQLRDLDQLRTSLERLTRYSAEGAPLSYRFGLYSGDRIYPAARSIYFQNFHRLLLASTQERMASILSQPPSTTTSDDFQQMYLPLKAYLITTRNHEHANWDALVQVLLDRCPVCRNAEGEKLDLMQKQFAFYASELVNGDPVASTVDITAVKRAQDYVNNFKIEAIYRAMLDDAAKSSRPVNFNRQFPGAAGVVTESYEVPAAFTKNAFSVMQKSLQFPERFRAEEWVLGPSAAVSMSPERLREDLKARYAKDYMDNWRRYLQEARVAGYGTLKDASVKLLRLTANDSPLLQLLWLAKENMTVDLPEVRNSFDSLLSTARDSSPERLVGAGSQEYMTSLLQLQGSVQNIVNTPNGATDANMLTQAQAAVTTADRTVLSMSQNFRVDPAGVVDKQVRRLLQEPITYTGDAVRRNGGAPAEAICGMVNGVTGKRPFNPRSTQQATLQEVQDLFRPQQGILWTMVQSKLAGVVARQGATWVNVGAAPQSPSFLRFLDHAQLFTDNLFPAESPGIHVGYTLQQLPAKGIEHVTIVIDGQLLPEPGHPQQFVWQGKETSTVSFSAAGQVFKSQGPWAIFDFLKTANRWHGNNPGTLDWDLRTQLGNVTNAQTSVVPLQFQLSTQGAQIFSSGFLSGLHCSAR